jgi:hypothetical protein
MRATDRVEHGLVWLGNPVSSSQVKMGKYNGSDVLHSQIPHYL